MPAAFLRAALRTGSINRTVKEADMPSRKPLVCLLAVASTLISTPNATVATTHDNLVGAWKLVSYENHTAGAPIDYPYGVRPAGLLIYDSSGHMAIQIMKTPPQKVASGDEYHLTPEEKIALMDSTKLPSTAPLFQYATHARMTRSWDTTKMDFHRNEHPERH